MPDPLFTLVIVVLTVAGLSVLLAWLIPDEYDRPRSEPSGDGCVRPGAASPGQAAEDSIPSFGSRST